MTTTPIDEFDYWNAACDHSGDDSLTPEEAKAYCEQTGIEPYLHTTTRRIDYRCDGCHATDISFTAVATWNVETQQMELAGNPLDGEADHTCNKCCISLSRTDLEVIAL